MSEAVGQGSKDAVIEQMLTRSRVIAVVGMSDKPWRASHNIAAYLAKVGYTVLPVNPVLGRVKLGEAEVDCYPDLDAAQAAAKAAGQTIDLVDVFRASDAVPAIVEDVIRLKIPYLWLQDEVVNDEAVARAEATGVLCVQNNCIFREHAARRP